MIERIMKEEEELYGLSYEKGTNRSSAYPWRTEYFGSDFAGLNAENKKVNILIVPESDAGELPWSNNCAIMLYAEELYQDQSFDI